MKSFQRATAVINAPAKHPHRALLARLIRRHIWLSTGVFLFLELGSWIALHHRYSGTVYRMESGALAVGRNFLTTVIGVTCFYLLYTFVAFSVRRWIAISLQFVMFMLLVVFLAISQTQTAIAAVRQDGSFVCVYRWPFSNTTVRDKDIVGVSVDNTGAVRALTLFREQDKGVTAGGIHFTPVWLSDTADTRSLDLLARELNAARAVREQRSRQNLPPRLSAPITPQKEPSP